MLIRQNFSSSFFNIKKTVSSKYESNNCFIVLFEDHFEEIRQRIFQSFFISFNFIVIAFLNANLIVKILQKSIFIIKFLQLSPGEYFITTIETSLLFGLLLSSPLFLNQLIFFLFPSFNDKEKIVVPFVAIISILLFIVSLIFSYFILIPITLNFFINYGKDTIEPLLSYNKYVNFIVVMFLSTGILFQIPIVQILISLINIISGQKLLQNWKFIVLFSIIISGIFTPSADPLTQILLASVLVFLYILGSFVSIFLKLI